MQERAAALAPDASSPHVDLAIARLESGNVGGALASYRRAVAAEPGNWHTQSSLCYVSMFDPAVDAGGILAEARAWSRAHAEPLRKHREPLTNSKDPERRLRVGYVSPTFRNHVMALSTFPLIEQHDRQNFEVFCYSSVEQPDAITRQFREAADVWRDVLELDDTALADRIREDRIDVLVDLNMHMADTRLRAFARRPAPVQIAHGAYPGTTGVDAMDYRITDPYLDPPETVESPAWGERYAERPLVLPKTFWCYGQARTDLPVSPLPALATGSVRFGCLNGAWKINDSTLELWARVLRAVTGSKLVLLAPGARATLRESALRSRRTLEVLASHGVESERVEFVPRAARPKYLEYYSRLDLGLDSLPYNGHMTSLDSFWMGVPVVTLLGRTVVGRAGLSLAANLELGQLVADNPDDFVSIAVGLARDLPRLANLRGELRSRMQGSPMLDTVRFTRDVEAAYRTAFRRWCSA